MPVASSWNQVLRGSETLDELLGQKRMLNRDILPICDTLLPSPVAFRQCGGRRSTARLLAEALRTSLEALLTSPEEFLQWIGAAQLDINSPDAQLHLGSDFE